MTAGWPLSFLCKGQIWFFMLLYGKTISDYDVKVGMHCKLNEYMHVPEVNVVPWPCPRSLGFRFDFFNIFKHLLLRNCLTSQSQISYRSSLIWGDWSLFKRFLPIWEKPLKIFLFGTDWPISLKLDIQHWALGYYQVCSMMSQGWHLIFSCNGQLLFLCICMGKLLNGGFFRNYWSLWYKVAIYSQLNEYMEIHMCQRSRSFFDLCPRSLRMKLELRWAIQDHCPWGFYCTCFSIAQYRSQTCCAS